MPRYFYSEQSASDDRRLWGEIINGDKEALGRLFDRHVKELLTYGCSICHDVDLVKDCIQDVFVNIWTYRAHLNAEVQVKFYLYRSLRNALRKELPAHAPLDELPGNDIADPESSPENRWLIAESEISQRKKLATVLSTLSDREREVVSLKYYSDMKIRQIASLLGLREQTVSNTLQNALVKLRKHLVGLLLLISSFL